METQVDKILYHMQCGYAVTGLEALSRFGCFRLADVIYKIKKLGLDVKKITVCDKQRRFAKYFINLKARRYDDISKV